MERNGNGWRRDGGELAGRGCSRRNALRGEGCNASGGRADDSAREPAAKGAPNHHNQHCGDEVAEALVGMLVSGKAALPGAQREQQEEKADDEHNPRQKNDGEGAQRVGGPAFHGREAGFVSAGDQHNVPTTICEAKSCCRVKVVDRRRAATAGGLLPGTVDVGRDFLYQKKIEKCCHGGQNR